MARVKDTQYVNPQDVYNYLISEKGLSREHALGMLANIQAESGFNVSIQEGGKAAGTGGVGLFQHTGPRRTALMKYTGGDISNWKSQVDFALQESPSKAYLSKTFSTPEEASTWFTTQWERPANASAQAKSRLSNINKFSNFTQYESTGNDGIANGERKFQVMLGDTPTYISLEDFNAELEKVKKAEEKTEKSADRKEVEQAKTKEQSFLEAMNTLYSNSSQNNSQAGAEDPQMGTQGTGYEPLDVPQQQSSLPTLPSLFSTAIPEMADGGPVYTYAERPGSYYQKTGDGKWMISNSGTGGQYVPVQDPTGERSAALNKGAVIYNRPVQEGVKPAPLQFTGNINQPSEPAYNPLYTNPNARYSETTQQVASKLAPQTKQGRQDLEFVKQNNANRKADVETFLTTQGNTPEQAAQIVGSYGSDWTDLESKYATDIRTMNQTAATIAQGGNPYNMQEFVPRAAQPLGEKVEDIIFNPFTSAGYAVRGQAIPDYMGEKLDNGTLGYYANGQFIQGRNLLDNVIDVATPIGWAHSGKNIAERATNDKSGDFWTEENAWDALNVLPGLGFAKAAKAVKGLEAVNSTTSLARLGNNVLDLAERAQLTRTKPQLIESAIDAGSIAREPFYAPQRTSLFNPVDALDFSKGLQEDYFQYYDDVARGQFDHNALSQNEYELLKSKYRNDFENTFGSNYDEKDLLSYAKQQTGFSNNYVAPIEGPFKSATEEFIKAQGTKAVEDINLQNAISDYTSGSYRGFNQTETAAKDSVTKFDLETGATIKPHNRDFYEQLMNPLLQDAILQNKIAQPTNLYRGISPETTFKSVWRNGELLPENSVAYKDLLPGDEYLNEGFTSASLHMVPGFGYLGGYSKITAPVGQSYAFPNAQSFKYNPTEMETILPQKLRFRVDNKLPLDEAAKAGYLFEKSITNPYKFGGSTQTPSWFL